jgi:hypothetical protein
MKQRIVRTDGELRFIRCVSIPVMEKGKVVRFVGTLMDITEQERLTQELRLSEFYLQEGERLARMGSWSLKPDRYAKRAGRKIRGIRKSALDLLESYSWPGNIRELQNVIERSLIVCETDEFTIDQSWLSGGATPIRSTDQLSIETSVPGERDLIEAALAQTKGKVSGLSGAAAKLGIRASTLESNIRSLKINKYRFK